MKCLICGADVCTSTKANYTNLPGMPRTPPNNIPKYPPGVK